MKGSEELQSVTLVSVRFLVFSYKCSRENGFSTGYNSGVRLMCLRVHQLIAPFAMRRPSIHRDIYVTWLIFLTDVLSAYHHHIMRTSQEYNFLPASVFLSI